MTSSKHDLSRLSIDRSAPAARRRPWALRALVVVLVAAVLWLAWRQYGAGLVDPRPVVATAPAQRVGGEIASAGTAANGYVVARRRAALSTDIQGRLVEIRVEEGDHVAEGDLIARLDTAQLEAQLERTEADLERARATFELARKEYERTSRLEVPRDVSQLRVDQTRAAMDAAAADVDATAALVRETQVRIERSSVYAPFSGVIVEKNAEVGEVVSAISAAGPNARGAVATIVDFDTLEVQVELAQTSLRAARLGAPVLIYLDAYPERAYRGEVRQIWPTADRNKATVELRVGFLERDERILPEMGVRVVFLEDDEVGAEEPQVWVPTAALAGPVDARHVFVLQGGTAVRRDVTTGAAEGGRTQVLEGLTGGEQLVLDPPGELVDGDEVRRREGAE